MSPLAKRKKAVAILIHDHQKQEIIEEQEILENIIKDLGATPIITTAEEHDKAVALISHLPMVIAQALCKNIKDNKLAQELASSGFKDTTRLALSNLEMATDMVTINKTNIVEALNSFNINIEDLLRENYSSKISEIKKFRENLYN